RGRRPGAGDRDVLHPRHRLSLVQPDRLCGLHRVQCAAPTDAGPARAARGVDGPVTAEPVIAFGQQPCGLFPRRSLAAKTPAARRLQAELGGRIVFFCHDSDHDPRETRTIVRHRATGERAYLNFTVPTKLQRKFSPLYVKRIAPDWHERTARQLPNYVDRRLVELFRATAAETVADVCLEMYRGMGLLDGIEIARSSDPALRRRACEVTH